MAEERTKEDEWRAIAAHGRRPEWIARFAAPRPEFDEKMLRWRTATLEERGRATADLMRLVDAVGRFPPKRSEFPGFPRTPSRRRPESMP